MADNRRTEYNGSAVVMLFSQKGLQWIWLPLPTCLLSVLLSLIPILCQNEILSLTLPCLTNKTPPIKFNHDSLCLPHRPTTQSFSTTTFDLHYYYKIRSTIRILERYPQLPYSFFKNLLPDAHMQFKSDRILKGGRDLILQA